MQGQTLSEFFLLVSAFVIVLLFFLGYVDGFCDCCSDCVSRGLCT